MSVFKAQRIDVSALIGAVGLLHEIFLQQGQQERPTLLYVCGALMGLPLVVRADALRRDKKRSEE